MLTAQERKDVLDSINKWDRDDCITDLWISSSGVPWPAVAIVSGRHDVTVEEMYVSGHELKKISAGLCTGPASHFFEHEYAQEIGDVYDKLDHLCMEKFNVGYLDILCEIDDPEFYGTGALNNFKLYLETGEVPE